MRRVSRFEKADAAAPRWDDVLMWSKVVALGPHKTCQLFAFAGNSPLAPVGTLGPLVDGLALSG